MPPMTDPMELVGRLESHMGKADMAEVLADCRKAAACIREMVEQGDRHLEAAFMWAWARGAGTFLQDPDGLAEWRIYRRSALSPLPPAPGAEDE